MTLVQVLDSQYAGMVFSVDREQGDDLYATWLGSQPSLDPSEVILWRKKTHPFVGTREQAVDSNRPLVTARAKALRCDLLPV